MRSVLTKVANWFDPQTSSAADWRRFLRWAGGACAALASVAALLVYIVDPYGVVPFSLRYKREVVDLNQRYFYPLVARQGEFDSFVLGTSTIRLVDPKQLDALFGGRFANFGMNAGTAWEQWKLADLWLRERGAPKTLLVGLDLRWCDLKADTPAGRTTERGFPEWVYDENPWNDLLYLFNGKTVEIAFRAIAVKMGMRKPRFRSDGFEIFTPPDAGYDLQRARHHLWGGKQKPEPVAPAVQLAPDERAALRFPGVEWLTDIAVRTQGRTRLVFLWTPPHLSALPVPGSREDAIEAECKARVTALAKKASALTVDWRFPSPVTSNDENYWDPLHYRLPFAARLVESLAAAQAGSARDPGGAWVRTSP